MMDVLNCYHGIMATMGAKLTIIKGERYLRGRVKCESCKKPFKLFWREDFSLYRYFHCATCDGYIAGLIKVAKEEAAENPEDPWPFSITFFDLDYPDGTS
jgi:hypothetical protein